MIMSFGLSYNEDRSRIVSEFQPAFFGHIVQINPTVY